MPNFQQFQEFDIRVGTIIEACKHPTARKPAYQIKIDFGTAGIKMSSAQLTERYTAEQLKGKQIVGVLNFPPRKVADFTSDVLILGAMLSGSDVVLLQPGERTPNGTVIG